MRVTFFKSLQLLSEAAAEEIVTQALASVAEQGIFSLVLTGGQTPGLLYEIFGSEPFAGRMPWRQTHLFWGDERCVSPENPASNYRLAREAFLEKGHVPEANIHRMAGENPDPVQAARDYDKDLRDFFHKHSRLSAPRFDCLLLGMGGDGHIASLFPGSTLLAEKNDWVAALPEPAGSPMLPRITLTLPALQRARKTIFLISGEKKRAIFTEITGEKSRAQKKYPAALLEPEGELVWFIAE